MRFDNIDLRNAEQLGIKVKNTVETNNVSVAELTLGLLFALARHISRTVAGVKHNEWTRISGTAVKGS